MAESTGILDIKSGKLFPFQFLILGGAFFVIGVIVFSTQILLSLLLILAGVITLTAHEGTEINPAAHTFREYNSVLFIKYGKVLTYGAIEKIFINSGKVSQKMYTAHTMQSSTFTRTKYNAYLKFTDGIKVFLIDNRDKVTLLKKADKIAGFLNTHVVDTTV